MTTHPSEGLQLKRLTPSNFGENVKQSALSYIAGESVKTVQSL